MGGQSDIAEHGLLGDGHSAALVARDGTVSWWCPARFDGRSVFASLLDPAAGHWSITAVDRVESTRRYLPGTLVLETTHRSASGELRVTDALAVGPGSNGHLLGRHAPHALVRVLEVVAGEVEVAFELVPRLEYGLIAPELRATAHGYETAGGPDRLSLWTDRPLDIVDRAIHGRFTLTVGQRSGFVVRHEPRVGASAPLIDPFAAVAEAVAGWRSWSEMHPVRSTTYRTPVGQSALVLQGLTYQPTGAMVAATTTSLPEVLGGASNWDYRFAWLRDAAFSVQAMREAACADEAVRFFEWMTRAASPCSIDDRIQVVFGVDGERDLTEHELDHLAGYRGSRPVRIGNDAWRQSQLDVLGEVLDCAWQLREPLGELEPLTARFLAHLADVAADEWRSPDAGIWEGREGDRHYTTSKVMCWVALDRAVRFGAQLGDEARVQRWAANAQQVRAAVLSEGWCEEAGAYTGAIGSNHLDAGVLLMPLVGIVPADEPRMRRTLDAIDAQLGHDGLVHRWTGARDHDEGAFVLCSYWLADCYARAGEIDRASAIFDRTTARANDLGLLSEEVDDAAGLIGNFPQALSHIGLINAACSIERATAPDAARPGGATTEQET